MSETKKPIKLGALSMVFLCISIIFTIMAYGYGAASATLKMTEWCYDNIEPIAQNEGYTIFKKEIVEDYIPKLLINTTYLNTSCLSNSSICEA